MAVKNLSLEELKAERADLESRLAYAEYQNFSYRGMDDHEEMRLRWDIRRYRSELSNIERELELRDA